jgi:predicted ribosomally synthesized peptide with nif11-like leader
MSWKQVKQFAEEISRNPQLRAGVNAAKSPNDVIALGGQRGYSFTEKDLQAYDKHLDELSSSISKEELARIAGGYAVGSGDLGFKLTNKNTCGTPCCGVSTEKM